MLSHLRRRIGVFTALAVLAALVPALTTTSPASSAPATTAVTALTLDDPADYSACPTAASIPSAGFTDTTDAAVDCLAYYGITNGVTATTYEPTSSVTRWQMALYLTRAFTEAGGTLGTGADQGFTDIAGKSTEIQTAINQIKQLGITTGTTATTYSPDDNVTREQMAMFIERWLTNTRAGAGGTSEADATATTDASITYINGNCGEGAGAKTCDGKYNYTDIDSGSITVEASLAIKELYSIGIHDGASATTFNGSSDMTRAAMATFLVAALDHSNLRPEGLYIQAATPAAVGNNSSALSVSYRDANFDPIASAPIDTFYWTDTLGAEGQGSWTTTGLCNGSYITAEASSLTKCYIDTADPQTDDYGNLTPAAATATAVSSLYAGGQTHYVWTDAVATTFDNDTKGSGTQFSSVVVSSSPAADELHCSMDTDANANTATAAHVVKFADVVTVTCQFMSGSGITAATTGIAVPEASKYVTLTNTRTFTTDDTGLQTGDVIASYSTIGVTDAAGSVSFTITGPTDTSGDDKVTDVVDITRSTGGAGIGNVTSASYSGHMAEGTSAAPGASDATIHFSLIYDDDAPADVAMASVTQTQTISSALAAATGVTRSNTATFHDMYGDPLAGISLTFTSASELPNAIVCDASVTTDCTSVAAHGLVAGQYLDVVTRGAFRDDSGNLPVDGTTVYCVGTVTADGLGFALVSGADCSTAIDSDGGSSATGTAASPMYVTTRSFDHTLNTRTTGSSGTATFSWIDTQDTSGKDTVTATGGNSNAKALAFYRLTATADFTSTVTVAATPENTKTCSYLQEFDAVGKDYILKIITGADIDGDFTSVYKQYTYDSNDQFSTGGIVANVYGTPGTEATWVTAMTTNAAVVGGTCDDVTHVDITATPVASIQRHVTG